MTITNKLWIKFLDWLYKAHSITKDWTPDKRSIELWEEFRERKYVNRAETRDTA